MNSRERLIAALNHETTDRVPIDLGATSVTGISAVALHRIRQAMGLSSQSIKIHEPFQLLGNVEEDVRRALNVDVVGVWSKSTFFGYKNTSWKNWTMPSCDISFQVGQGFTTTTDEKGDLLIYPNSNTTAAPSGKLPKGGYYFDAIVRQEEIDEDNLTPREDFKEQFTLYSDEDLQDLEEQTNRYYKDTDYGIILNFGGGSFGDVALLPGTALEKTPGLRDIEDFYAYHILCPEYIKEMYDMQLEVALENLKMLKQAVGNKIQAIMVSGTDFGTQISTLISPNVFRDIYKPRYTIINDWIHKNTKWKTFFHSCGAIAPLLDDFVEMGVDILNPVQCSAVGMDAQLLKDKYGDKLVFWGGGIDTQNTFLFKGADEVTREARERIAIFSKGGGYVFNPIHNIQANTPVENIRAFFDAVK